MENAIDYGGLTEEQARKKLKDMGYSPEEIERTIRTKKEGQAKFDAKNSTLENGLPESLMKKGRHHFVKNGTAGVFNIGDMVVTIDGDEGEIVAENNYYYQVRLRSGGTVRMRELDLEKA